MLDFEKMRKTLADSLKNLSAEDLEKYFPKDTRPKGWLSIDDHLPMMYASDIRKGYSEFKVKYENGEIGDTIVCDHNTWKYYAIQNKITHWYNE